MRSTEYFFLVGMEYFEWLAWSTLSGEHGVPRVGEHGVPRLGEHGTGYLEWFSWSSQRIKRGFLTMFQTLYF